MRSLSNRPADANEWTMRERLDWEWNGLCSLKRFLRPENYSLDKGGDIEGDISEVILSIRQDDLDLAMEQIQKLNETLVDNRI